MLARLLYQCGRVRLALDNLPAAMVVVPAEVDDGEGFVCSGLFTGAEYLNMLDAVVRFGLKHGVPQTLVMEAVGAALDAGPGDHVALEPAGGGDVGRTN